ncbi:hypothetical protein CL634_06085 [bacterium]|nr:hypothetical protein [bacterium]
MSRRTKRLTPSLLRKIVLEERAKLLETSDPIAAGVEDPEKVSADEVDAADLAATLEKDIDHVKVLKIKERRLRKDLKKIQERRRKIRSRILRKI